MTTSFKKGLVFRIYPNAEQQVLLERTFGCSRKVWNELLALFSVQKTEFPNENNLSRKLTELKAREEFEYLNEVSSKALQYVTRNLASAYKRFFKSKKALDYPKFKSKHRGKNSFTLTNNTGFDTGYFSVKDDVFTIAKCKTPVKIVWHRELPSQPTSVTISKNSAGQYYASFLCDIMPEMTYGQGIIGIDLGIKTLATMSNGEVLQNPKHYVCTQKSLRKLQRRLSKKVKGSKNRDKARKKVAKCHLKIANQRKDYLHKLTRSLVRDNQAIVIEDLNVSGMSRNRHLSKHILDAGFGMFRRFLEHKVVESQWCRLIIADRFYPSTQLCSHCGCKPLVKIKLGVSEWTCLSCKTTHGRDTNASYNLEKLAILYENIWRDLPGAIIKTKSYRDLISL